MGFNQIGWGGVVFFSRLFIRLHDTGLKLDVCRTYWSEFTPVAVLNDDIPANSHALCVSLTPGD